MRYIAVDFETANSNRSSVCQLGLAVVQDDRIVERCSYMVRPNPIVFDYWNVRIHGITADDVKDAPEFNELWRSVAPQLEGETIVAHNATFDLSVLRETLERYRLPFPRLSYFCSLLLARKVWPEFHSHRLSVLADAFGISFKHHDAGEDAAAVAQLLLIAADLCGRPSIQDLAKDHGITPGRLFPGGYEPCTAEYNSDHSPEWHRTEVIPGSATGKRFALTGVLAHYTRDEAKLLIEDAGGRVMGSVTRKTNYLVVGSDPGSKLIKAQELGVKVIDESEMLGLLKKV